MMDDRQASEAERIYDEKIAPLLMEAGKIAEQNGLAFVTFCEWSPGECGSTATLPKGPSASAKIAFYAAKCNGNADSLIMAIMRDAREHGHSSICLSQLGVPLKPENAKT